MADRLLRTERCAGALPVLLPHGMGGHSIRYTSLAAADISLLLRGGVGLGLAEGGPEGQDLR